MTQKKQEIDFATGKRCFAKLSQPLFNRDAKLPADGYYQIVPKGSQIGYIENGDNPEDFEPVMQVIDDAAIEAIVKNSGEVLLDYEHFSWDRNKSTEAAGWIRNWQAREDGVYAQIEWSDAGKTAIEGKRYKFLSPVFLNRDLEDLGESRYRPTRIADAGLTNKPNFKNLKPLSNKDQKPGSEDTKPNQSETKIMNKEVAALLGLKPDASEESVNEAVKNTSALLEKGRKFDQLEKDHKALKNKISAQEVDAILDKHSKVVNDDNRDKYRKILNSDRETGEAILDELSAKADEGSATDAGKRVYNRDKAGAPKGGADAPSKSDEVRAVKIRNRAHEIQKEEGLTWSAAFNRAKSEVPA